MGFTLIELLTVIAIIGILAAILIPTIGKVRENARFSKGTANIREIARATILFANENKGWIPHDGGSNTAASNVDKNYYTPRNVAGPWWNELPPYMGIPTLAQINASRGRLPTFGDNHPFICPNATVNSTSTAPAWLCYAPAYLLSQGSRSPGLTNIREVRDNASRAVLFSESTNHARGQTGAFTTANPNYLGANNATLSGSRWSSNRALLSFFDGSVRGYKQPELLEQGGDLKGTKGGPVWSLRD